MNTRSQILLDKYIAKPVAYLLNFIVRIAGKLLSIDHNLNKDFKTIAVCKFKGMGSIIQATPMLQAIRNRFPDAEIIFVSSVANKSLLEKIDLVDTIITLDDRNMRRFGLSCLRALVRLVRKRPDVYIDLEIYSDFSTLFTLFTLSKNRIGFYLRSSSFRMGIYTQMMFFNPHVPISDVYLQLAALLYCRIDGNRLFPLHKNIKVENKHRSGTYILINPNASDIRLERRWNAQNFISLVRMVRVAFPDHEILLIGGKSEKEYTDQIANTIHSEKVASLAGATTIDELIYLIRNATLMVSNDTGPMHIAFSTETPVICLFGPCAPGQYGMNRYAHVVYKRVYCSPCVHEFETAPCNGNNICMQLISVQEVYDMVVKVLSDMKYPVNTALEDDRPIYQLDGLTLGLVNRQL